MLIVLLINQKDYEPFRDGGMLGVEIYSVGAMSVGVVWRGLFKFRQHLIGLVEGLFIAVRRAVAPGTLLCNLGVFQSRNLITLSESHFGKKIVNISLLDPILTPIRNIKRLTSQALGLFFQPSVSSPD